MAKTKTDRYLYRRKVQSDSGRTYTVSFDTAIGAWVCSCPGCTRRRQTCKHITAMQFHGPDHPHQPTPAGLPCPLCGELRIDHRAERLRTPSDDAGLDLAAHLAESHPAAFQRVGWRRLGNFQCACGFVGYACHLIEHIEREDDLHTHIAEARLVQSVAVEDPE